MLPGPFQAPPFPWMPAYISPLVWWLLFLGAVVGIIITFFRFVVAEPDDRVNNFLVFLLAVVLSGVTYLALMNGEMIAAWFRRTIIPIFS